MKRIIILFITASVALSAAVLPVSAAYFAVNDYSALYLSAEKKKQKDYSFDHHYDIQVDVNTVITVELPHVKKLGYAVSDKSVLKVKKTSYKDGAAKITVVGLKDGTAYLKVFDKNNRKRSSTVKLTVLGDENKYNYEDKFGDTNDSDNDYAADVLEIVNYERKQAGLDALVLDEALCKAADIRVKELNKQYGHTRPDGSSCFTVLSDENIGFTTTAENIAKGQKSAKEVMQSWMNSDGHRGNILTSEFKKIGIGYDPDSDTWVQLFTD